MKSVSKVCTNQRNSVKKYTYVYSVGCQAAKITCSIKQWNEWSVEILQLRVFHSYFDVIQG